MGVRLRILVFLLVSTPLQEALRQSDYFEETDQDILADGIVYNIQDTGKTLLSCAISCQPDAACVAFGYKNSPESSCLLFKKPPFIQLQKVASENGFRFFIKVNLGKYGFLYWVYSNGYKWCLPLLAMMMQNMIR